MTKYNTLIFDLDDTLIDNTQAMRVAFSMVLKRLNIEYQEELYLKWLEHDKDYWFRWENGLMILPQEFSKPNEERTNYLRSMRFVKFFNVSLEEASTLNKIFVDSLTLDIRPITNAIETLEYLSQKYNILIATNGPINAAKEKIALANIRKYITHLYCSEDIHIPKPNKEYFDYLFNHAKVNPEGSIIIGDSLTSDVQSGIINGFDSCWYNPKYLEPNPLYPCTMEIHDLIELKKKF